MSKKFRLEFLDKHGRIENFIDFDNEDDMNCSIGIFKGCPLTDDKGKDIPPPKMRVVEYGIVKSRMV